MTTAPISMLRAKPSAGERGRYDGHISVLARNGKAAGRILAALRGFGFDGRFGAMDEFTHKRADISARDPYLGVAHVEFWSLPKEALDVLRKRVSVSHVAKSHKVTNRELSAELSVKTPLTSPTYEMWLEAAENDRRGFSARPADWVIERYHMGTMDAGPAITKATYAMLDAENRRRAALARKK